MSVDPFQAVKDLALENAAKDEATRVISAEDEPVPEAPAVDEPQPAVDEPASK